MGQTGILEEGAMAEGVEWQERRILWGRQRSAANSTSLSLRCVDPALWDLSCERRAERVEAINDSFGIAATLRPPFRRA